jgi:hypothetical protein
LCATYPAPRGLFTFAGAHPSRRLLALAVISALALAPVTLRNLQWQLAGVGGEHAEQSRWMGAVILSVCLVLAGLLAATRRPGWRALGILTGITYVYLGAAALSVPDQPGSWGTAGGLAALIWGAAYVGAVALERPDEPEADGG